MRSTRLTTVVMLVVCAVSAFGEGEGEAREPGITIHEAVITGDLRAVEQHVQAGSDIDAVDQYGSTPLTIAATFGITDAARVLIEAGADLDMPNDEGSTPLHIAAFFCRVEIVELLLEAGASTSLRNAAGKTAAQMVSASFEQVRPIYDGVLESLAPLGLELDYAYLEETRPLVAALIES